MAFAGRMKVVRWLMGLVLAGGTTGAGWTQTPDTPQPQTAPAAPEKQFPLLDYSRGWSHFPDPLAPYMPQHVPPANLNNTPRIGQLLHEGKLMLSMDDAVALALENNLDLVIARYTLSIADTDVLRAQSGANMILGTPLGVVQNTPGGGVGGLGGQIGSGAGGTNPGSGGAGAGTNGLTSNTEGIGPLITSFDPVLTGTIQSDHSAQLSSSAFTGVPVLFQNTGTYNFSYSQGFAWGCLLYTSRCV